MKAGLKILLLCILLAVVTSKPLRKQVSKSLSKDQEQQSKPLSILYPLEETKETQRFKV